MAYKRPKYKMCERCGSYLLDNRKNFGIQATGQQWKQDWCLACRTEWVRNKKYNEEKRSD